MAANDPTNPETAALQAFGAFRGLGLLEVGCGDGRLTAAMAGRVQRLVALDPSQEALGQAAAAIGRASFCRASGEQLPFAAQSFPAVLFSLSLHHQDSRRALAEAARVIVHDGRILVLEPTVDGQVQRLFHLFEDESAALEAAQAAVAASPLRVSRATVFEADWRFADKDDFSRYMFAYHGMPRNAGMEARLFRNLGPKVDDQPLVLKDTLQLLCLVP